MIPFSVLDLSPIVEGGDAGHSLRHTLDLARHCETWGFHRFWLTEHHGIPSVASAATSVVIAAVAAKTRSIRVGAGGIMLPNHSPLLIAEQFGTLEALFPGRIDLGLGRAGGMDEGTASALDRDVKSASEKFPHNVLRVQDYLSDAPRQRVLAVPGQGAKVPLWILGSSLFGAKLAAHLGLPFAFASQFAPPLMTEAVDLYRNEFEPSAQLARPYVMLGCNVFAAKTDEEAQLLASSAQQAFVHRRHGRAEKLPPPRKNYRDTLSASDRAVLDIVMACSAIGTADTVTRELEDFIAKMQPDELLVATQMYDPDARLASYQILAEVRARLCAASASSETALAAC